MQTDHVDLYQAHNMKLPQMNDTFVTTMEKLKKSGRQPECRDDHKKPDRSGEISGQHDRRDQYRQSYRRRKYPGLHKLEALYTEYSRPFNRWDR